jgi:hypothetical protein
MVRSLHTQDNTNVEKNVNIYISMHKWNSKTGPNVSEVGGDLHFRSFRIVISLKLVT